ncbi:aldolase/citrate lyase family protein, partial [Candidatus Omnitrophota bacterium]
MLSDTTLVNSTYNLDRVLGLLDKETLKPEEEEQLNRELDEYVKSAAINRDEFITGVFLDYGVKSAQAFAYQRRGKSESKVYTFSTKYKIAWIHADEGDRTRVARFDTAIDFALSGILGAGTVLRVRRWHKDRKFIKGHVEIIKGGDASDKIPQDEAGWKGELKEKIKSALTSGVRNFFPAVNRRYMRRSLKQDAIVIFDLEDSLPAHRKEEGRHSLIESFNDSGFLAALDASKRSLWIRINDVRSPYVARDLIEVISHPAIGRRIDGIFLPKVESAADVKVIQSILKTMQRKRAGDGLEGWQPGRLRIQATIESARAVENVDEIAKEPAVVSLISGLVDYKDSLGAWDQHHQYPDSMYEKSEIIRAARAHGVLAVESITPSLGDKEVFKDAQRAIKMGFSTKASVHPDHIKPINKAREAMAKEVDGRPKSDFRIGDYDADESIEEYDWDELVHKATHNLPLVHTPVPTGDAHMRFEKLKGVIWKVGVDFRDLNKARTADIDTVHITVSKLEDLHGAEKLAAAVRENSRVQELALEVVLPEEERDQKALISAILSDIKGLDTLLLKGEHLNPHAVNMIGKLLDSRENDKVHSSSGHPVWLGISVVNEAQYEALPEMLDQSMRVNCVVNDYVPVYNGTLTPLDKFLTDEDINSKRAIKMGGILNVASARGIKVVQGRLDNGESLEEQTLIAAKNGYVGFVITDPEEALRVRKSMQPSQDLITEAIDTVKNLHMAEGRFSLWGKDLLEKSKILGIHEKNVEDIRGAIKITKREYFGEKKDVSGEAMVDKATQLMMAGVLNRARELHRKLVLSGNEGFLSLDQLHDIELYANPKLSTEDHEIDFTEYEPVWDSEQSDRFSMIRNRRTKDEYRQIEFGRYDVPRSEIDTPGRVVIPPVGVSYIYSGRRKTVSIYEQKGCRLAYGSGTVVEARTKIRDGRFVFIVSKEPPPSTQDHLRVIVEGQLALLEKHIDTLRRITGREIPNFTLVITTDLTKTNGYVSGSDIRTKTVYLSPAFFVRAEHRQLIDLYHELISHIANKEQGVDRAMRDTLKFTGYFRALYFDTSGLKTLEPLQDGRLNDIGIGWVMDSLEEKRLVDKADPYFKAIEGAREEALKYIQKENPEGISAFSAGEIEVAVVKPHYPPHLDFDGLLFVDENWRQFTHVAINDPDTGKRTIYLPQKLASRFASASESDTKMRHILVAIFIRDILNILGADVKLQNDFYSNYIADEGYEEDIVEELFARLSKDRIPRFGQIFENWAGRYRVSGKVLFKHFVKHGKEKPDAGRYEDITWEEAEKETRRIGKNLLGLLNPGEEGNRIALYMRKSPKGAYFDIASLSVGIVNTHVRSLLKASLGTVTSILTDFKPKVIVVNDRKQLEELRQIENKLSSFVETIIVTDEDISGFKPFKSIKVVGMDEFSRVAQSKGISDSDYDDAMKKVRFDDVATIVYTSGTTGKPKGVKLTQRNLVIKRMARRVAVPEVTNQDTCFSYLPFSHSFGRTSDFFGTIYDGATYVFARSTRTEKIIEDLSVVRPTILRAAPNVWEAIKKHVIDSLPDNASKEDIKKKLHEVCGGELKIAFNAAAELNNKTIDWFHSHGVKLDCGYGFTENSGSGTTLARAKLESQKRVPERIAGRPLPGAVLRMAEWTNPVSGEKVKNVLFITSPWISIGYSDPSLNVGKFLPSGWFATGDVMSEEGGIYIFQRRDSTFGKTQQGLLIDMQKVDGTVQNEESVRYAHVVADKRPFNTALVWPDRNYFQKHFSRPGESFDVKRDKEKVRRHFQDLVKDLNEEKLERHQKITRVVVMSWHRPPEDIINEIKGTLVHRAINNKYKSLIDRVYQEGLKGPDVGVEFASDILRTDSREGGLRDYVGAGNTPIHAALDEARRMTGEGRLIVARGLLEKLLVDLKTAQQSGDVESLMKEYPSDPEVDFALVDIPDATKDAEDLLGSIRRRLVSGAEREKYFSGLESSIIKAIRHITGTATYAQIEEWFKYNKVQYKEEDVETVLANLVGRGIIELQEKHQKRWYSIEVHPTPKNILAGGKATGDHFEALAIRPDRAEYMSRKDWDAMGGLEGIDAAREARGEDSYEDLDSIGGMDFEIDKEFCGDDRESDLLGWEHDIQLVMNALRDNGHLAHAPPFTIKILALSQSPHLGEDCKSNGLIGINQAVTNPALRRIILYHEMLHEIYPEWKYPEVKEEQIYNLTLEYVKKTSGIDASRLIEIFKDIIVVKQRKDSQNILEPLEAIKEEPSRGQAFPKNYNKRRDKITDKEFKQIAESTYLYKNPRDPELFSKIDRSGLSDEVNEQIKFDEDNYYWDEEIQYWRSRHFRNLVLGTYEDIQGNSESDHPDVKMKYHVAIRTKAGFTIYACDNHQYSYGYIKEAQVRGEVPKRENIQIFVDRHNDGGSPQPTGEWARMKGVPLRKCQSYIDDVLNMGTFNVPLFEDGTINRHWQVEGPLSTKELDDLWTDQYAYDFGKEVAEALSSDGTKMYYPVEGEKPPFAPAVEGLKNNMGRWHFFYYYFKNNRRPQDTDVILNLDTDATPFGEEYSEFLYNLRNDKVTPSTVLISTSFSEETGSVRKFGSVSMAQRLAKDAILLFANKQASRRRPSPRVLSGGTYLSSFGVGGLYYIYIKPLYNFIKRKLVQPILERISKKPGKDVKEDSVTQSKPPHEAHAPPAVHSVVYSLTRNKQAKLIADQGSNEASDDQFVVGKDPVTLKGTMLRICSAVFMYDPQTKVGALVHIFPYVRRYKKHLENRTLEEIARAEISNVIDRMVEVGAKRENILSASLRSSIPPSPDPKVDNKWSDVIPRTLSSLVKKNTDLPSYILVQNVKFDLTDGNIEVNHREDGELMPAWYNPWEKSKAEGSRPKDKKDADTGLEGLNLKEYPVAGERQSRLFLNEGDFQGLFDDQNLEAIRQTISKNYERIPNKRSVYVDLPVPFGKDQRRWVKLYIKGIRFDEKKPIESHEGKNALGFYPYPINVDDAGKVYRSKPEPSPDGAMTLDKSQREFENYYSMYHNEYLKQNNIFVSAPIGYGVFPDAPRHKGKELGFVILGIDDKMPLKRLNEASISGAEEEEIIDRSGRTLRLLHDAGFSHPYLHAGNISANYDKTYIHDMDAVEFLGRENPNAKKIISAQIRDIFYFYVRYVRRHLAGGYGGVIFKRFINAYFHDSGEDSRLSLLRVFIERFEIFAVRFFEEGFEPQDRGKDPVEMSYEMYKGFNKDLADLLMKNLRKRLEGGKEEKPDAGQMEEVNAEENRQSSGERTFEPEQVSRDNWP